MKKTPATSRAVPRSRTSPLPGGDPDLAATRIYATVDSIPHGRVATYGQVADEAGLPRRARLVGRLLGQLTSGRALPWHRVVNARGAISERPGAAPAEQRRRLEAEGVAFDAKSRIDLARFGWRA